MDAVCRLVVVNNNTRVVQIGHMAVPVAVYLSSEPV